MGQEPGSHFTMTGPADRFISHHRLIEEFINLLRMPQPSISELSYPPTHTPIAIIDP